MRNWSCIVTSERRRLPAVVLLALLLSGCTHLFFYPSRQQVLSPAMLKVASQAVALTASDGTKLFAWHLPAEAPRGVVCFFHGNAENISTHIVNVAWLPASGYEVLLVDYRGYGASAGKPQFPEVFNDVRAGLDWCLARGRQAGVPVYAFGQSLGAALVLDVAAQAPYRTGLAAVVADSGFSNYRRIARDAMSHSWLLWPLQYPLSWLITPDHDPEDAVSRLDGLPLLVLNSSDDDTVRDSHAQRLLAAARQPACFLRTHGPHNAALNPRFPGGAPYRQALLDFFAMTGKAPAAGFACLPPMQAGYDSALARNP